MRSEYCRREWEHALALPRQHFVYPIYWQDPLPRAPELGMPPEELNRLHFARIPVAASPAEPQPGYQILDPAPAAGAGPQFDEHGGYLGWAQPAAGAQDDIPQSGTPPQPPPRPSRPPRRYAPWLLALPGILLLGLSFAAYGAAATPSDSPFPPHGAAASPAGAILLAAGLLGVVLLIAGIVVYAVARRRRRHRRR